MNAAILEIDLNLWIFENISEIAEKLIYLRVWIIISQHLKTILLSYSPELLLRQFYIWHVSVGAGSWYFST